MTFDSKIMLDKVETLLHNQQPLGVVNLEYMNFYLSSEKIK